MIVLEYIGFRQLYIAEGTSVVSIDGLEDALLAVHMPAAGDVAVLYFVEADVAEELLFELPEGYLEVPVVHENKY